jgi:G3E family GTPase
MVNDFGAVNIDARLVAGIEGDVVDLSNGCICCTMRGGLVQQTLKLLSRTNPPEYLLVEASGISDPVGVAGAFRTSALRETTRLDALITLVDAEHVRNPRLDQQLIESQLASADLVVLNKVDLVDDLVRADLRSWIQTRVPQARILDAVQAQVPIDVLLDLSGSAATGESTRAEALADALDRDRDEHTTTFESWSYAGPRPLSYRRLHDFLSGLPPGVFRTKGIAYLVDAPGLCFIVQMVGRRLSIDVGGPWVADEERRTDLVFIGGRGSLDRATLVRQLDSCISDSLVLMSRENMKRARLRSHALSKEEPCASRSPTRARFALAGDRSPGTTRRS